jgi:hypothetical protein
MEWAPPCREQDHIAFRLRLEEQRLDEILNDGAWQQRLRHDYKSLRVFKRALRHVLAVRCLDLEQEILKRAMPVVPKVSPVGGLWDDEDDQKCAGDDASLTSSEGSLGDLRMKRLQFFTQGS